jgi:hypothetical protein
MKRLSESQIKYTLFHLFQHWKEDKSIASLFVFESSQALKPEHHTNKILFPLSENQVPVSLDLMVLNTKVPVLYPVSNEPELYQIDGNGNLLFAHDFLKSAFYLLSGWQELQAGNRDFIGRYPHASSIQSRLKCTTLPLVNYYFEAIVQGLEAYGMYHNKLIERKRLFREFGFLLSHDVDRVAFYHPREVLFKLKQFFNFAPRYYSKALTLKLFFKGVLFHLNPFPKSDPWWIFENMIEQEKRLGIRSSFYFLKSEHRVMDSRYQFSDVKIKRLIKLLLKEGFEVGLHGTIHSAKHESSMQNQIRELTKAIGHKPRGIRQHYLRFFHPYTFRLQVKAGLKYDTSLAFAEHEGYRNGYCYPFKPYDFEKDEMIDIWEVPLTLMEVTVLNYRELGFDELKKSAHQLIVEARKFGGIYSMLWHNCRLDEYQYPGVTKFYNTLLESIVQASPTSITGKKLMEII